MFRYCLHTADTVSCTYRDQLGMEDGSIRDDQLAASSEAFADKVKFGRLNRPTGVDNSYGGWCPLDDQFDNSWIRVDLGVSTLVAGVIMQTRDYYTMHWVSEYKVQYGTDDVTWQTVMDDVQGLQGIEMVREIV